MLDGDEHLAVKIAWLIYQKIIAAYADPNRRRGKKAMTRLIDSIRRGVPAGLEEIAQLGRTLWRRRADILAFFDHHASNGPPKPSTDAWKHCAATPSDSETSPTTAGAHYCTAAHSTHSSMHSELRRASKARCALTTRALPSRRMAAAADTATSMLIIPASGGGVRAKGWETADDVSESLSRLQTIPRRFMSRPYEAGGQ